MLRGKIFSIVLTAVFFLSALAPPSLAWEKLQGSWRIYKDTHVIVYYHPDISEKYIKEFAGKCEHYYDAITERLGFNRFVFWLWEERAKIFIYKTKDEYLEYTGRPFWSGASVNIKKKTISTFYGQEDFFDTTLPHEFAHIILREFIGLKARVPLWFEEGVACVNEKDSHLKHFLLAKKFYDKGIYMPISDLERIRKHKHVIFPAFFYSASASLIFFLLENYKSRSFMEFCKELYNKTPFYEAMDKIYDIKNAKGLNDRFFTFMKEKSREDIADMEGFGGI